MDDETIVFVVDGKVVSPTVFKSMDVNSVESMEIVRDKSDEFKKFAKENTSTVMIITTKK